MAVLSSLARSPIRSRTTRTRANRRRRRGGRRSRGEEGQPIGRREVDPATATPVPVLVKGLRGGEVGFNHP